MARPWRVSCVSGDTSAHAPMYSSAASWHRPAPTSASARTRSWYVSRRSPREQCARRRRTARIVVSASRSRSGDRPAAAAAAIARGTGPPATAAISTRRRRGSSSAATRGPHARRRRRLTELLVLQDAQRRTLERHTPRQRLAEHHTDAVPVGGGAGALAAGLLRSHVVGRASTHGVGPRPLGAGHGLREPEVDEDDAALRRDHDVRRLDIPMNHPARWSSHTPSASWRNRSRMRSSRPFGLLSKRHALRSAPSQRRVGIDSMHRLQRDSLAGRRVDGFVHHAHATFPERADHTEARRQHYRGHRSHSSNCAPHFAPTTC